MLARSELWGGLFWLAIGVFVAWSGRDLGLGNLHQPGSGFALFWIGLLMIGLASVVIGAAVTNHSPAVGELWNGTRWPRVLLVVVLLLLLGLAFERVGFIPGATALLLVLMLFVDPVGWLRALVVSISAPALVWVVMTKWLKIQLPAGVLAGWLG